MLVNVSLLNVFYRTLDKYFAESWNRRSAKKVTWQCGDGHGAFAECPGPDTRQTWIICRVSNIWHSTNMPSLSSVKSRPLGKPAIFYECQILGTRQTCYLCRVSNTGHSAKTGPERINVGFFAECHSADTRQRSHFSPRIHRFLPLVPLCRVYFSWHSANSPFAECNTRQSCHI